MLLVLWVVQQQTVADLCRSCMVFILSGDSVDLVSVGSQTLSVFCFNPLVRKCGSLKP